MKLIAKIVTISSLIIQAICFLHVIATLAFLEDIKAILQLEISFIIFTLIQCALFFIRQRILKTNVRVEKNRHFPPYATFVVLLVRFLCSLTIVCLILFSSLASIEHIPLSDSAVAGIYMGAIFLAIFLEMFLVFVHGTERLMDLEHRNKHKKTHSVKKQVQLYLKTPSIDELEYRIKICADRQTMSYNIGYGDNKSGCYFFTQKSVREWYKKWFRAKGIFYAYVVRASDNNPVGEVNIHFDAKQKIYLIGVVIEACYRGQGYATEALHLLASKAFYELGIKELYNNFPSSRTTAEIVHNKIGFERINKDLTLLTESAFQAKNTGF